MPERSVGHTPHATTRTRAAIAATLLVAAAQPAIAQNGSVAEIFGRDLEHAVGDILHIWTAPVRLRVADAPAVLGLTQAIIITGSFDGEIQQWVRAR